LLYPVDVDLYFKKEIDERVIRGGYNFSLIRDVLSDAKLFNQGELHHLDQLQDKYRENISRLTASAYKKEIERLAIDLSWKSSQIEGNTYTLLETERLLKERETAAGKTKEEATMLLNHKEALDFVVNNPSFISPLSIAKIVNIHSILVRDLGVERNIRKGRVGISGTNYRPLDNEFQIKEALSDMCDLVNRRINAFEKTLLVLVTLSYIQPFGDGNKRTARIISNALLIYHGYCPVSFRTIDSVDYKKAILVFYEQNNIWPFKKLFIDQFEFAVNAYF
jgi:Fic family protein